MKKILASLMLVLASMSVLATDSKSANANTEGKTVIKIGAPKAPPILPVLKMIEDNAMGDNVSIDIQYWNTGEQMLSIVQAGEKDLYSLPLTAMAMLYNKGLPIKLLNVNTWGPVYFLSTDENVKSWSDLKGKTIYVQCTNSPADILTQYFLKEAGLKEGDYEIRYMPKMEMANWLILGKGNYATMIEPLASKVLKKNKNMKAVMSFEKEWQRSQKTDSRLPHAGFAVSDKFAAENRELVLHFEKEFEKALKWVVAHPAEAGALAEAKLGMKQKVIKASIPKMGLEYQPLAKVEDQIKYFYQFLFDANAKSVGGKVPDANLYFK